LVNFEHMGAMFWSLCCANLSWIPAGNNNNKQKLHLWWDPERKTISNYTPWKHRTKLSTL